MNSRPNFILIFGIIGLVALVIIVTMFARSQGGQEVSELFTEPSNATNPSGVTSAGSGGVPRISNADHVRGGQDASIIWIEYGDFECPFCKRYHGELEQLLAAYPDDVQVVYRHYPLEIHTTAYEKAVASECVAELSGEDAFWQYHDMLFERSNANAQGISLADLPNFAVELGIDRAAFSECLASGRHDQRINGDIATGTAAGVTGTPGTVIVAPDGSGTLVPGVIGFNQMQQIMDFLLNEYAAG